MRREVIKYAVFFYPGATEEDSATFAGVREFFRKRGDVTSIYYSTAPLNENARPKPPLRSFGPDLFTLHTEEIPPGMYAVW